MGALEILQSDWTAIFLQQNKSRYRADTRSSVSSHEGQVTPNYIQVWYSMPSFVCGMFIATTMGAITHIKDEFDETFFK